MIKHPGANGGGRVDHRYYMALALKEAQKAFDLGEVPVGALMVKDGEIVSRAHNLRETNHDPTAHAEVLAIRQAARALQTWRLTGTTLYVTVEPCPMCAGAIVQARVDTLVYGAIDPKAGAVDSLMNLVQFPRFNHQVHVIPGVMEEECREIIRRFFAELRG
ncbi:hypothetical protein SY88_18700 [Clostridiales bacterium PH28_bin88]|nr:hypothetical protein SY88_18700 [Clostridiales bacterium PH28_bin88]